MWTSVEWRIVWGRYGAHGRLVGLLEDRHRSWRMERAVEDPHAVRHFGVWVVHHRN